MSKRIQKLSLQVCVLLVIGFLVADRAGQFRENKFQANQNNSLQELPETPTDSLRASVDLQAMTAEKKSEFLSDAQLVYHDQSKSHAGFTLYPVSGTKEVTLLNSVGQIVHKWENIDVDRARLLPNGHLLVLFGSKALMKQEPWKSMRKQAAEYDWNGNLVWSYKEDSVLHHDVQRLANGNTLLLKKVSVPEAYYSQIQDPLRRKVSLKADSILEVDPQGNIVWAWNSWEHFDLNDCGIRECLGQKDLEANPRMDLGDIQDWTHINTISVIPDNKWYDQGDQRFRPGNLIVMPRNFWTVYIVDRETGKLVWDYHGDYRGGIIGGHEPQMIAKGLPGEGNILMVDNGNVTRDSSSFILEINPSTKKLAWVYDQGPEFHTSARGSVQRLANGNTLISEDNSGRVFEVTKNAEKVWEYDGTLNTVRSRRYDSNYCPQFGKLSL